MLATAVAAVAEVFGVLQARWLVFEVACVAQLTAYALAARHLDELAVLGDLLRRYAVRLFWTPNYLLAPQQAVADAVEAAQSQPSSRASSASAKKSSVPP